MGRIRTIKPEMLENRRTAALSSDAFRLFIGCILQADDYGNFYAEPGKLQGAVFWAAPPCRPIEELLQELASDPRRRALPEVLAELSRPSRERVAKLPLLILYSVDGERYGHLSGWAEHQKVDKPGKPRVPGPDQADVSELKKNSDSREGLATISRQSREGLAPDLRSGSPISDPEGEKEGAQVSPLPVTEPGASVSTPDAAQPVTAPGFALERTSAERKPRRPRKPRAVEPEAAPLPVSIGEVERILAEASGGRYTIGAVGPGIAAELTRKLRALGEYTREDMQRLGRHYATVTFPPELDARHLATRENLRADLAHARKGPSRVNGHARGSAPVSDWTGIKTGEMT